MSNPPSSTPARGGLSLYANLLDPSSSDTPSSITKGPVVFKTAAASAEDEASAKKPQIDAGISCSWITVCAQFTKLQISCPPISTYTKTAALFSEAES